MLWAVISVIFTQFGSSSHGFNADNFRDTAPLKGK